MSSRKLEDCSVPMIACLSEFEAQLTGKSIAFVRACTYRSPAEQNDLYALGRTRPGLIVTHAKAGQSLHNDEIEGLPASNAADYYPLLHGKLCSDKTDQELELWEILGETAEQCGLVWGGRWTSVKRDRPHVQLNQAAYLQLNVKHS
jgi:peptidoglycan L-alanyl-D-glutamate endopeptidase CwlK